MNAEAPYWMIAVERIGVPMVVLIGLGLIAYRVGMGLIPPVARFFVELTAKLAASEAEHESLAKTVASEHAATRAHVTAEAALTRSACSGRTDHPAVEEPAPPSMPLPPAPPSGRLSARTPKSGTVPPYAGGK